MTDICLFPIPDCVTFPGTIFPLHVFEPRYRQMINFCIDNDHLVAICHTEKMISPGKQQDQTLEQALSSNQAMYKPFEIFSAGKCELLDRTDDGRIYLNVHMQQRYRAMTEKQTIPYLIYQCEEFVDTPLNQQQTQQANELKQQLLASLIKLSADKPNLTELLTSIEWQQKQLEAFSFEIFGLVSFPAHIQQQILSLSSPLQRLELAQQLLSQSK